MKTCEKCGEPLRDEQFYNGGTVYLVCDNCDECKECGHLVGHSEHCSHATDDDKPKESEYGQLARFLLH